MLFSACLLNLFYYSVLFAWVEQWLALSPHNYKVPDLIPGLGNLSFLCSHHAHIRISD